MTAKKRLLLVIVLVVLVLTASSLACGNAETGCYSQYEGCGATASIIATAGAGGFGPPTATPAPRK